MRWREYRFWSVVHGGRVSRISLFNLAGDEFFTFVDAADGKDAEGRHYRQRREIALDMLQEAVTDGLNPGEVRLIDAAE